MLLLVLASFAFAVAGYFMTIHSPKGLHIVVGWISVVFFGLGGFYMLYATLKERFTGKPFLTITDKWIVIENMKQVIIDFSDVESFEVLKARQQKFVAIHYNPGVEQQKLNESNTFDCIVRTLNRRLVNAQDNISTTGTGMKSEELCDLLNERLRRE